MTFALSTFLTFSLFQAEQDALTDEEMLEVMQYQLNVLQRQRQSESSKKKLGMEQLKMENARMKQTLQNQQEQIQQLTQSLNQCFQVYLDTLFKRALVLQMLN